MSGEKTHYNGKKQKKKKKHNSEAKKHHIGANKDGKQC